MGNTDSQTDSTNEVITTLVLCRQYPPIYLLPFLPTQLLHLLPRRLLEYENENDNEKNEEEIGYSGVVAAVIAAVAMIQDRTSTRQMMNEAIANK